MADAKLWGKVYMLRICIAVQRGFNKPEGWIERKHIRFSKEKCQLLPQGQKHPLWQHKQGADCLLKEGPGRGEEYRKTRGELLLLSSCEAAAGSSLGLTSKWHIPSNWKEPRERSFSWGLEQMKSKDKLEGHVCSAWRRGEYRRI